MSSYKSLELYSNELYHHGIKGQKWGVRRFQNPDGTRTEEGKKRYSSGNSDNVSSEARPNFKKAAKIGLAVAGAAALGYGAYKLGKSGMAKEFRASQKVRAAMVKDATLLNTRKLSDSDLAMKVKRLQDEAQLRKLTYEALTSSADPKKQMAMESGKKILGAALTGVGTYAGYAALSGKVDPKQAAQYMFSNPNKKK